MSSENLAKPPFFVEPNIEGWSLVEVEQSIELRSLNQRVLGSNPSVSTIFFKLLRLNSYLDRHASGRLGIR